MSSRFERMREQRKKEKKERSKAIDLSDMGPETAVLDMKGLVRTKKPASKPRKKQSLSVLTDAPVVAPTPPPKRKPTRPPTPKLAPVPMGIMGMEPSDVEDWLRTETANNGDAERLILMVNRISGITLQGMVNKNVGEIDKADSDRCGLRWPGRKSNSRSKQSFGEVSRWVAYTKKNIIGMLLSDYISRTAHMRRKEDEQ